MATKPDWRKLEAVLCEVALNWGFELDQDHDNGDISFHTDIDGDWINLTDLAKELEDRL